jgi:hypothetical protein
MKFPYSTSFLLVLAVILPLGPTPARAELTLGFGQPAYAAAPGGGLDLAVYLTETDTTILVDEGLNGAGLIVSFNLTPYASDPAQVVSIGPNPGLNDSGDFILSSITPADGASAGSAELLFSVLLSDILFPPAGSSSILLGVFHVVAGTTPGETTLLSVDVLPGGSQFITGAGTILDTDITGGSASIIVVATAVPEPSSLLLAAASIVLGVCLARRARGGLAPWQS